MSSRREGPTKTVQDHVDVGWARLHSKGGWRDWTVWMVGIV